MDAVLGTHRFGFAASLGVARTTSGDHVHAEIELNLPVDGVARCHTAFGRVDVPPGRLVAFWGGYPHRLVVEAPLEFAWLTVPLAAVGAGARVQGAVEAMLSGAVLAAEPADAELDLLSMRRWTRDLREGPTATAEAALLEVRGRIARLAPEAARVRRGPRGAPDGAERLLRCLARHYLEDLTVGEVARLAGVHPTYAAHTFTSTFSVSLWDYVIQLRIAHAQRLLRATDREVDRVAHESGFRSRSNFYRAFAARVGATPGDYRRSSPPG